MERFFVLDKFNTWYDWKLVLTTKGVTPPEPKTNYVDISGMNGSLDLSESLTGEVSYKDRTITATFWTDDRSRTDRERLLRNIVAALHGKKIKIIEPDDPNHYFYGRVKIKSVINTLPYAEFSIEATCEPWRYALEETSRSIELNSTLANLVIRNDGVKTLCPTITVTDLVTIVHNGSTTSLSAGVYKISDLKLHQGANVIGVSGKGSVTFTYREAEL